MPTPKNKPTRPAEKKLAKDITRRWDDTPEDHHTADAEGAFHVECPRCDREIHFKVAAPDTTPSAAEPKPEPAAASAQEPAGARHLTALLKKCFRFDHDADEESRQLLFDILERTEGKDRVYPFPVIAANTALGSLGVNIGVDELENPNFLKLLNHFGNAISGHGYGGYREQLISELLESWAQDMSIEDALAIVTLDYQQKNADVSCARQALTEYPEELVGAIEKAVAESPALRKRFESRYGRQETSNAK